MTLRNAWTDIIQADDYDLHMANVGQAEGNALLVQALLDRLELDTAAPILVAGAGTGQMLEYEVPRAFHHHDVVFADINPNFLAKLRERARSAGLMRFHVLVDDVEATQIQPPISTVVLVLVLEHVDWRRALASMADLKPDRFLIVIQRNPPAMETMVAPNRELPGSLQAASEGEQPKLVAAGELLAEMGRLGYDEVDMESRPVPDGKEMLGFLFARKVWV